VVFRGKIAGNFDENCPQIVIGDCMVSRFYAGMGAELNIAATAALSPAATAVRQHRDGRLAASVRRSVRRTGTGRIAIVLSLFLGLLAVTLLFGAPALLDPVLRPTATREASRVGDVLFMLPDGSFCRHLSFDNRTAQLTGGAVERCEQVRFHGAGRAAANGFSWGPH
jgi:hypothetical protein